MMGISSGMQFHLIASFHDGRTNIQSGRAEFSCVCFNFYPLCMTNIQTIFRFSFDKIVAGNKVTGVVIYV